MNILDAKFIQTFAFQRRLFAAAVSFHKQDRWQLVVESDADCGAALCCFKCAAV